MKKEKCLTKRDLDDFIREKIAIGFIGLVCLSLIFWFFYGLVSFSYQNGFEDSCKLITGYWYECDAVKKGEEKPIDAIPWQLKKQIINNYLNSQK